MLWKCSDELLQLEYKHNDSNQYDKWLWKLIGDHGLHKPFSPLVQRAGALAKIVHVSSFYNFEGTRLDKQTNKTKTAPEEYKKMETEMKI